LAISLTADSKFPYSQPFPEGKIGKDGKSTATSSNENALVTRQNRAGFINALAVKDSAESKRENSAPRQSLAICPRRLLLNA